MTQEVYIDGIGNISVQGPVVTLTFTRVNPGSNAADSNQAEEVLNLTMTGQNLLKITNVLNNTLKRLAERSKETSSEKTDASGSNPKSEKKKKDSSLN